MNKGTVVLSLLFALTLTLLAGCGSSSSQPTPAPLSAGNLNLIFVVSEDLAYHATGDVNPTTANLTNQGLQRSLLMATFLQQQVLGTQNVTGIYALEPMTHLQTANNYPDMAALETIQQFAMLNQTSASYQGSGPVTANSYPIFASYSLEAALPDDVAPPAFPCAACQGLDFRDQNGDNEALVTGIVKANAPGFYVFSAPWETTSSLLANINKLEGYNLSLPASYISPNYIYAISIAPSGSASLVTYNSYLTPPSTYPVLPPLVSTSCNTPQTQASFSRTVTGGIDGAVIPAGTNTNETVYFVRHADAHPKSWWDDGNYIGKGQWRALDLPNALRDKIHPTQVYAIDPSVGNPGGDGSIASSYVRPSLTVEPYAIANNLPFNLAASVPVFSQNPPQPSTAASIYFFNGGTFSNQTILVGWEHDHIPPTVNALLTSYNAGPLAPPSDKWPDTDYDTIWTVKLDAVGNVTVNNGMCEGISSTALPDTPPQF